MKIFTQKYIKSCNPWKGVTILSMEKLGEAKDNLFILQRLVRERESVHYARQNADYNNKFIRGVFTQLYQQVLTEIYGAPKERLSKLSQRVITEICNLSDDLNEHPIALPSGHVVDTDLRALYELYSDDHEVPQEKLSKLSQGVITEICSLGDKLALLSPSKELMGLCASYSKRVSIEICEVPQKTLSEPAQRVITLLAKRVIAQLSPEEITKIRKSQKEIVSEHVISKRCTFADGASLVLDGVSTMFGAMNIFKIFKPAGEIAKVVKDVIEATSNWVRYRSHIRVSTLEKRALLFKDYLYEVDKTGKVEKTEIIFKRLTKTLASACKVILWFAPQFWVLKVPQYLSLSLEVAEIFFNRKNIFTEDGKFFSAENILKIILTLSYHVISCVAFSSMAVIITMFSIPTSGIFIISLGFPVALLLVTGLVDFFNWLVKKGMLDTILSLPQIDKLVFANAIATKIANITKSFIPKSLSPAPEHLRDLDKIREHNFDMGVPFSRGIYLIILGFQLCISAASELIASA